MSKKKPNKEQVKITVSLTNEFFKLVAIEPNSTLFQFAQLLFGEAVAGAVKMVEMEKQILSKIHNHPVTGQFD